MFVIVDFFKDGFVMFDIWIVRLYFGMCFLLRLEIIMRLFDIGFILNWLSGLLLMIENWIKLL